MTASAEFQADILIKDEKILAVGTGLSGIAEKIIDAKGRYVLPGGIDQHTHFGSFGGHSFETSRAAVAGGTTTVVDFVPQEKGDTLMQAVEKHAEEASCKACVDYAFSSMIMDWQEDIPEQILKLSDIGISAVKMFTAYRGTPFFMEDDRLLKVMFAAKKAGITMMVHAENADMIAMETQRMVMSGYMEPYAHALSHPVCSEAEAVRHVIALARYARCPLMLMHVTTSDALYLIYDAWKEGQHILAETCTHYLTMDDAYLAKENFEGAKYVCSPPLRSKADCEALWHGVGSGWLNAVSSDHCAVTGGFEAKKRGLYDFRKIPSGVPGVQERMVVLWSQGVAAKRISRQRFVELTATNPARNLGLKGKGQIAPGFDADLVIYDPEYRGKITLQDSYEGLDYTIFEGFPMIGRPEKVFLRGKLVAENGICFIEEGYGKRIPAHPYALAYTERAGFI